MNASTEMIKTQKINSQHIYGISTYNKVKKLLYVDCHLKLKAVPTPVENLY